MSTRPVAHPLDEGGFGLIEVVVSLFLLSIVSLSVLSLLLTSLKTGQTNSSLALSNEMVSTQIETVRNAASNAANQTCSAVRAFVSTSIAGLAQVDAHGDTIYPHRALMTLSNSDSALVAAGVDANGCPSTYPGTVIIRAWVTKGATGATKTFATTRVFVLTAS